MECDEWKNALCALPSQNGVVFASAGSVFVPSNTSSIQLNALQSYAGTSCQGNNVGVGRQITENVQYDISACDIGSMDKSFLLHGGYLYIVDAPYPAWIHLLLCVSTVFTLSGMLYILRPKETESSENVSEAFHDDNTLVQSKTLDGVMVIVIRYLKGKHAPGVFIDMCTSCISIVFISSYSSLDHPFINVIYAVMVFRQWNKIIRFTYGDAFVPGVSYVLVRFTVDAIVLCITHAYGWNMAFNSSTVASLWLPPMMIAMYAASNCRSKTNEPMKDNTLLCLLLFNVFQFTFECARD
eukprot:3939992-Rhodomonas_salina.2